MTDALFHTTFFLFSYSLSIIFSGVLYGIQNNNADQKLKYGNFFSIIIIPSIYLGLLAGIILL